MTSGSRAWPTLRPAGWRGRRRRTTSETSACPVDLAGRGERQVRDVEPDPRPVRPASDRAAPRRARGPWSAGESGRPRGPAPSSSCGHPDHDHLTGRRGPQHRLHAGSGTVAPPVVTAPGRPSTTRRPSASTPAVPDRGEPVGVPAQRPGGAGVPVADEAATGPRSPRPGSPPPRRGTAAGPRRARPRPRTTARRRRSSGARVAPAATARSCSAGGEPVAGDHDGHAGQRGPRASRARSPGVRWACVASAEVVDEPRPGDRRRARPRTGSSSRRAVPAPTPGRPRSARSAGRRRRTRRPRTPSSAPRSGPTRRSRRCPGRRVPPPRGRPGSPRPGRARADVDAARVPAAGAHAEQARVGRVHAARDEGRDHDLDQVAGEEDPGGDGRGLHRDAGDQGDPGDAQRVEHDDRRRAGWRRSPRAAGTSTRRARSASPRRTPPPASPTRNPTDGVRTRRAHRVRRRAAAGPTATSTSSSTSDEEAAPRAEHRTGQHHAQRLSGDRHREARAG